MARRTVVKTQLQLERLPQKQAPYEVPIAIAPGLVVRVSAAGKKSFRWDRGRGHQPRVLTYGQYPSVSLEQALKLHGTAKQRHQDGIGVVSRDTPTTVADLADVFYTDRIQPHRRRPENVRRTLDNDILPRLGRLRLRSVTAPAVRSLVRDVIDRGSPAQASKVLAHAKQMFGYGVSIGAMEANPAQSLTVDLFGVAGSIRSRVLSDNEIVQFYKALDEYTRLSKQIKIALKLLLLLGLRSGELRHAKWSNVDWEAATLTIPVEHQKHSPKQAKRAKPYVCPLSIQALALVEELKGIDETWLFPGKQFAISSSSKPLSGKAFGRAVRRMVYKQSEQREPLLKIPAFTPHDLRRTLRSGLSRLRVAPHIAERCLNHSLGGIVEVYDHHDYLEERGEALQKWSDHVYGLLFRNQTVIPFRAANT